MRKLTCENCRFWVRGDLSTECHRHAPVSNGSTATRWPFSASGDWCGEHELVPQALTPEQVEEVMSALKAGGDVLAP